LMLVIVMGVVWPGRGARHWLVPGAAALALALVQPLALAPVYVALGLYLLARGWLDREWPLSEMFAAASAVLFSLPVLLYDYHVYTTNLVLAGWATQNVTPAPSVLNLTLGYGLVGLLAIPGGVIVARRHDRGGMALLAWSMGTLALVYVPLALQRRFITGLGLPLAMLAAIGLNRWLLPSGIYKIPARLRAQLSTGYERQMEFLAIAFSALGSLFVLTLITLGALNSHGPPSNFVWLYLSQDEAVAMQWLLTHAQNEVVLSTLRTGNLLPGRAGVRVFVGHPFETVDAVTKFAQAEAFFRGEMPEDEWRALQNRYHIHYVFVGPAEKALGGDTFPRWQRDRLGEFQIVFQQNGVTIYHIPR